jgi:hypothetical protein
MQCWICGDDADTGEHMIKGSDLRDLFGHTTTHKPLYRKINSEQREIVQGPRSTKLKFKTELCSVCNNARTQQHDKSWEALSKLLRNRVDPIKPGEVIRLATAFSGGLRPGPLGVHLYFCKLTGCLVRDGSVPLETDSLAQAILGNKPHPNIYLGFLTVTNNSLQNWAAITPIQTISMGGNLIGAQWFYFVGRIGVHVTYAAHIHRPDRANLWHPSSTAKIITIGKM